MLRGCPALRCGGVPHYVAGVSRITLRRTSCKNWALSQFLRRAYNRQSDEGCVKMPVLRPYVEGHPDIAVSRVQRGVTLKNGTRTCVFVLQVCRWQTYITNLPTLYLPKRFNRTFPARFHRRNYRHNQRKKNDRKRNQEQLQKRNFYWNFLKIIGGVHQIYMRRRKRFSSRNRTEQRHRLIKKFFQSSND